MKSLLKRLGLQGRSVVTAIPYLWLLLFFLIPFVIVLKISFSTSQIAMPPYEPLLHWTGDKVMQIKLNLGNFAFLVEDDLRVATYAGKTIILPVQRVQMAFGVRKSWLDKTGETFPVTWASRALSPAVNDPTTAVQVLDRIETILSMLAPRTLDRGAIRDSQGNVRLVVPLPSWEEAVTSTRST